jgi:hypothetical protein
LGVWLDLQQLRNWGCKTVYFDFFVANLSARDRRRKSFANEHEALAEF